MTDTGVSVRHAAAAAVGRVTRHGSWTQQTVRAETTQLDQGARSQTEAMVYGTVRRLAVIDRAIHLATPNRRIENRVTDLLRVACWDIHWGHTPIPIAVSLGVEAVRAARPRAAGFANAVLRRLASDHPFQGAMPHDVHALPAWAYERLTNAWGKDETITFAESSLEDAPIGVRHRPGFPPPRGTPSAVASSFLVTPENVEDHPVQDPASVAVSLALAVEPGMTVLDVAAAPGGKTLHLIDLSSPGGTVVAIERHRQRLRRAAARVTAAAWVAADGRLPPLRPGFDRILVDAPCSGLGTLRRRPEIRHRISPAEVERLAELQGALVRSSLALLKPGGRLVYSVCTVLPEETIDVVAGLGARPPEGLAGKRWGDGILLGPHLTQTDGMFIAVVER